MTTRTNLQSRYGLGEVLGKGGMGVVYQAVDWAMKREVALKTILDVDDPDALDLFYKEWNLLAAMSHPNIVEIYDIGEFEENGVRKPFFVMPLLRGATLDKLIRDASPRLTVENVVHIVVQASRGLHAAHEQGRVHRDIKPSNIFVMDDDTVKIIDFGIARVASLTAKTKVKGTLYYLAPEQLEMKPPTPLSDQFALAVVAYQALTRRRPFDGSSDAEVLDAIRLYSPPPAAEINQTVSYAISQVVHKAMAKQPYHRFLTAKDFGEALEKALRNEPLDCFDRSRLAPRMDHARSTFEQGDYGIASELLTELEAEGHLDQGIWMLRRQLNQAVRQTRIQQLLGNARRFLEASEHSLALRKIQEALDLDPEAPDTLAFKTVVEKERRERKIEEWIQLARQHLANQAFQQARDALHSVTRLKPNDTQALQLLAEADRGEEEFGRIREEKARLYQGAMQAWENGEVTSALSKLENLVNLERDLPETDSERSSIYQNFYNQVHTEHDAIKNAYEEARRNLAAGNFEVALATCHHYLAQYPNHALFQALRFDVEDRRRQSLSALIADTDRQVDDEPDLDRRIAILGEVLKLYPDEPHFQSALQLVRDKRDLVHSIVAKAHFFEERSQFNEALDQWQIMRSIHEKQPGLEFEIERLLKKRDQQSRRQAKADWVAQTDRYLEAGDYGRALKSVESALAEFPGEPELLELHQLVLKSQSRATEAQTLLAAARELSEKAAGEESLVQLRNAFELDPRNSVIRTVLVNSLLERAHGLVAKAEWEGAEATLGELLSIEPHHPAAESLAAQLGDHDQEEFTIWCLAQARRWQAEGEIQSARALVAQGLEVYPKEPRLLQIRSTLERAQGAVQTCENAGGPVPEAPAPTDTSEVSESETAAPPPAAPTVVAPAALVEDLEPKLARWRQVLHRAEMRVRWHDLKFPVGRRKILYVASGFAGLLAVLLAGRHVAQRGKPVASPSAEYHVAFRSSPHGAAITVNDQPCGTSFCAAQLEPGAYEARATLPGYADAAAIFTIGVKKGGPGEVSLKLAPLPAQVGVSTDLMDGTITLDDRVRFTVPAGGMEIPDIPLGTHRLQVQYGGASAALAFEISAGVPPRLIAPVEVHGLRALLIAGCGPGIRMYSSVEGTVAIVDGKPAGTISSGGLDIQKVAPGHHVLIASFGRTASEIPFDSSSAPRLGLFLQKTRWPHLR